MSKRQSLMLLGVWVLILPFLGFTDDWKKIIAIISGVIIVCVSYRLKPEMRPKSAEEKPTTYAEHRSTATPNASPEQPNRVDL